MTVSGEWVGGGRCCDGFPREGGGAEEPRGRVHAPSVPDDGRSFPRDPAPNVAINEKFAIRALNYNAECCRQHVEDLWSKTAEALSRDSIQAEESCARNVGGAECATIQ